MLRMGVGFGVALFAMGLTNWGGLPWTQLLGVELPDMLLVKTTPQALSTFAVIAVLTLRWSQGHPGKRRLIVSHLAAVLVAVVALVALLVLTPVPAVQRTDEIAISIGTACLMGAAMGALLSTWGVVISRSQAVLACAPISLLTTTLLSLIAYALPNTARVWMLVVVLLASVPLYILEVKGACADSKPDLGPVSLRALLGDDSPIRAQAICMVALVFGFSFVRTTVLAEIDDKANLNNLANILMLGASIAAFVWFRFVSGAKEESLDDDGMLPYQVMFPIIATLAVLMPVLSGPILLVAAAVLHAVFFTILAFLPVVAARTCPARGAEQTVAALVFGASVFLSVGVSTFLAWLVYQEGVVNVTTLLVCALAITYAMLLAYFYLQRQTRSRRRHEVLIEEEQLILPTQAAPGESRRENVEGIASEYFLTAREADVLLLLAKGYSQRGIAGKLDVSDNTVRTHMRNLYRKLQIHSRQEAIELVEGLGRGEGVRGLS